MKRVCLLLLLAGSVVCRANDRTVAFVGRTAILESDVNAVMKERGLSRDDALRACIHERLFVLAAQDAGVQVSPEDLDRAVDSVAKRYPERKAFLDDLAAAGMSPEMFRSRLRDQLLVQRYLAERVERTITVSPAETMRACEEVRAQVPVELLILRRGFSSEEEARRAAQEWKEGEEVGFESVGWMRLNQLLPEVKEALAPRAAGQMAGPVQVSGNWYLFIVKDRRESAVPEDAVVAAARRQVFLRKYQEALQSLVQELSRRYSVTVCGQS